MSVYHITITTRGVIRERAAYGPYDPLESKHHISLGLGYDQRTRMDLRSSPALPAEQGAIKLPSVYNVQIATRRLDIRVAVAAAEPRPIMNVSKGL